MFYIILLCYLNIYLHLLSIWLEPFLSHQIINVFEYCIRLNYDKLLHTYICTFSLCHCLPLSVWILSKFQNDKPMVDIKKKKKHACIFSPQRYFFFVLLLAALHVFCAYSVPPFEGLAQSWMSVINLG